MTRIPDSELHKLIMSIPDPRQRKALGDTIAGHVEKHVRCLKCGRTIGKVYKSGRIEATLIEGEAWLSSWRPRLDGFIGFQCNCGNDSRLADAEKDVAGVQQGVIDRGTLEQIYAKLSAKTPSYPETPEGQIIDGFLIERVS